MDKEILIEKIASSVGINDTQTLNQKNAALKVASQMLKLAAENQRQLELKVAQLSLENDNYKREKDGMAKQALVDEISNNMFEKGLIKKSDIESKSRELMGMEISALEVFRDTISSIPEKTAEESVSDLTFLYGNNNIKEKEKETMAGAINSFIF